MDRPHPSRNHSAPNRSAAPAVIWDVGGVVHSMDASSFHPWEARAVATAFVALSGCQHERALEVVLAQYSEAIEGDAS